MLYLILISLVLFLLIAGIMVKLWRGYYGEKHVELMSAEELQRLEQRFVQMGAEEGIRQRQLFEGELLWSQGTQETWRWSWEAGKRGAQTYTRFLATFVGGLGQGIVLEKGGRERFVDEPTTGTLGPQVVIPAVGALPDHFLCKARDEERFAEFLTRPRQKSIHVLDNRVASFYFDDRRFYVQQHGMSVDEIDALLDLARAYVEDVIAWSAAQGVLAALETGQYQGALAELEQSAIRDTSVLEEQDVITAGEELPEAPT